MARTIIVCGYGPGISEAVARRFGAAGFQVALISRTPERVQAGASALQAAGIAAKGFACDLADTAAVKAMIAEVQAAFGPITVLHWNAYSHAAGDLTTCDIGELRAAFDLTTNNLVVAVQQSLPDLRGQADAAILVTGGGLAFYDPKIDAMAVDWNAMGLALGKAAQHKLVGVLHHKLAGEGIYVGEVVVLGIVKGTAFDRGNGTLDASEIAERFWKSFQERSPSTVSFPG
jgi:NADP-dependent 3-hydroxy acid dehydrogenase YdfG